MPALAPVLKLEHIDKQFPGVKALSDVSLALYPGEIHALVGENGAGKSTLMKILSGAYRRDGGRICLDGEAVEIDTPKTAENLGIAIIYQELNLFGSLTVAENLFVGRQPRNAAGLINWDQMQREAAAIFDKLGIRDIDVRRKVSSYSLAKQQMIEIAKAVSRQSRIVIMDEPTSSLTAQETEVLFEIMRSLRAHGTAVVFITHRMNEIFTISDRLTVLRDGQVIGTCLTCETNRDALVTMMIGRELKQQFPERASEIGEEMLRVDGLCDEAGRVDGISFCVRRGEVLGFAGLVGSGRTETMRLLFGVDRKRAGKICKQGQEITIHSPRDAIRHRIGFVTEDRKSEGLLLPFSCRFNTTLVALRKVKTHGILDQRKERDFVSRYVSELRIATPSVEQRVGQLSGGNQQKVVVSKWLFSDADVVIMDEPTRGVDVGAKREIYELIGTLVAEGKSVIVVSSEMEEVMGISDRIYVMREGQIAGELDQTAFSPEQISKYAIGG